MEQRNSLLVILLAALLGSATIVPRSGELTYTVSTAASMRSEAIGNLSEMPSRAHTAVGIIREFFSGKVELQDKPGNDDADAPVDAIIREFFSGMFNDGDYELYVALLDAGSLGQLKVLEPQSEQPAASYQGWKVHSLVAIVPDPVESALGGQFDDYVDTIERAVAAYDYVPDRFYNPWPSPSRSPRKVDDDQTEGQPDASEDSNTGNLVPISEREPGLILFRDADPVNPRLLVVFLVGETPTRGVHKAAFESALTQASWLPISNPAATCPNGPDCETRISALGPSFSGSVTSMTTAIQEWNDKLGVTAPELRIISGSATTVDPQAFENLKGVTYRTTIIPNDQTIDTLLSWLGKPKGEEVAILREEDTAFGSVGPYWLWPSMLSLKFPLHIADLQRRSAERLAQSAKMRGSTPPSLSNPNLPFDSEEFRSRRDLMPLYSTSEINSLELVLDSILREIDEHRITYVIISATDHADTLFLVNWLRQNCPKVIPIVLTADLYYLHTDANADTRGMVVASTYPLYLENQLWSLSAGSPRRAIQFSSDTSEGTYNAVLKLLGLSTSLLDYAQPFASNPDKPSCASGLEMHPLWISVVGADHLWPISIQNACVPVDYMFPISQAGAGAATDDELILYPKAFTRICGLIALGCLLLCSLILGKDTPTGVEGFSPIAWLRYKTPNSVRQILGPAILPEYSGARRRTTLLFSVVLLCLWSTVAYYFFLPFRMGIAGELVDSWKFWAALVVSTVVAIVWLALIVPRSWLAKIDPLRTGQPPWSNPPGRILSLLVLFPSAVVMACVIVWLIPPGDPAARLFLFLRTADFSSKVSPLVPMLLSYAAAIALILGALRRLALLESRQVLTPFLDFGTASFSGFADLEQRGRALVGTSSWSWRSFAIAAPIAIAYWMAVPDRRWLQRDIDAFGFEFWFFIFSLAVYVGIGLAIVKMVSVWFSVRTLLRRIYTHPSRGGYSAYRQQLHFLKEPAVDLLSRVPAMSQLEVALDQVRQLLITSDDTGTRASSEIKTRLDTARPWLRRLLPWVERSINETEQAQASAQWSLSILAKRQTEIWMIYLSWSVAYIFEPLWRTINPSRLPQPPAGTASEESKPIDTIGEIYIASRVVDFLRQVMPQLETLALTTTLAMLLMLFAVSSYPFPARDDLLWFSWLVVLATVGSMMWMFFSLNRDRVASMIAGTTPGQTDWNSTLVLQVATHALLPILVLLGAAFPARLGTFVTWIGSLFGGHA